MAREQRSCRPARSRPPSGEDAGPTITDKIKKRKAAGGAEEWDASACGVASARRRFGISAARAERRDRACGSLSTCTARFTLNSHTFSHADLVAEGVCIVDRFNHIYDPV